MPSKPKCNRCGEEITGEIFVSRGTKIHKGYKVVTEEFYDQKHAPKSAVALQRKDPQKSLFGYTYGGDVIHTLTGEYKPVSEVPGVKKS